MTITEPDGSVTRTGIVNVEVWAHRKARLRRPDDVTERQFDEALSAGSVQRAGTRGDALIDDEHVRKDMSANPRFVVRREP